MTVGPRSQGDLGDLRDKIYALSRNNSVKKHFNHRWTQMNTDKNVAFKRLIQHRLVTGGKPDGNAILTFLHLCSSVVN